MNIGISQRLDQVEKYMELRDSLDQRMTAWVSSMGNLPIPITNSLVDVSLPFDNQPALEKWINAMNIDAIILSGGNDIGEMIQRDLTEKCLLNWAETNFIPVLGICRGMQMMGVYFDGVLKEVDDHVRTRHKLKFDNQKLEFADTVNSYHTQSLLRCPDNFEILAKSEDGNIEAIQHNVLPWEGWMWHPERETIFSSIDVTRFKNLIASEKRRG